jgi:hypothetical protein
VSWSNRRGGGRRARSRDHRRRPRPRASPRSRRSPRDASSGVPAASTTRLVTVSPVRGRSPRPLLSICRKAGAYPSVGRTGGGSAATAQPGSRSIPSTSVTTWPRGPRREDARPCATRGPPAPQHPAADRAPPPGRPDADRPRPATYRERAPRQWGATGPHVPTPHPAGRERRQVPCPCAPPGPGPRRTRCRDTRAAPARRRGSGLSRTDTTRA